MMLPSSLMSGSSEVSLPSALPALLTLTSVVVPATRSRTKMLRWELVGVLTRSVARLRKATKRLNIGKSLDLARSGQQVGSAVASGPPFWDLQKPVAVDRKSGIIPVGGQSAAVPASSGEGRCTRTARVMDSGPRR